MIRRLSILPPWPVSPPLSGAGWQLSMLSGILVALSYPPLKLGFLSWFALVPWLVALDRTDPRGSAALGYLAGIVAHGGALYWLALNSGGPFPVVFASFAGTVIYLSLGWAVAGFLFSFLHTRTGKGFFLFPFLWISLEFVMSLGPLGFPWVSLSTPQAEYVPVIQFAEFTGIYGVSFWAAWLNVLVFRFLTSPDILRPRFAAAAAVVLVAPWLYGYVRLATLRDSGTGNPSLAVAAVQPNVGPHDKWNPTKRDWVFRHLDSMFVVAAQEDPDLIVWPESATPVYLRTNRDRLKGVLERVTSTGIPLLTGSIDWEIRNGERRITNSVLFISPDESIGKYDKIHLVPLAEYNPLSAQLPVSRALSLGNFTPGSSITVFRIKGIPFSSVVCYESVFPGLVRK
ncbi:MAG: apolipoprotein N-acyltransferase, partial [Fidelibacterota bacterium]